MTTEAQAPAFTGLDHEPRDLCATFVGSNADYYARQFERMSEGTLSVNWAAAVLGPIWAAARGVWWLFWVGAVLQFLALITIARGLWANDEGADGSAVLVGLAFVVVIGLVIGLIGNWAYQRQYARWRINQNLSNGLSAAKAAAGVVLMVFIYPLMVYRFGGLRVPEYLAEFPTSRKIALTTARTIDAAVDWLTINLESGFDSITAGIRAVLNLLELVFVGTPWPVMAVVLLIIAWRVAGQRVAIFTGAALAYLGFFGFWEMAMSTIALVGASVFICILIGLPFGIWTARSERVEAIAKPVLDFMQTVPSFVYLIPAIAFFSIGKPPGVMATVIFAMPPMIRLTTLGIRQVPSQVVEAALAFGASPQQLLFKVQLPLAVPSIMAGINQTIMMSLSMVVVAALIGAGGLGYEVLFSLQHVETGRGVLAGIAIAFCAMILDRIIQGSRNREARIQL